MLGERNPVNTPLALLPHPTKQQIFDAVVQHAAKMPEQCGGDSGCLYRDGSGNACFIGALLTDEEANRLGTPQHSVGIGWHLDVNPEKVPERFQQEDGHVDFLRNLQAIHDSTADPMLWPRQLKGFADKWQLDASEVERSFGAILFE